MTTPESYPRQSARTRRFTLGEPRSLTVAGEGAVVLFLRSPAGDDATTALWAVDRTDGAWGDERCVVDPVALGADGADLPAEERARRERVRETAGGIVAYSVDAAGRRVAFALGGRLWVADVDGSAPPRELATAGTVFDPTIDPTGAWIAYLTGRELRVVNWDGQGDRLVAGEDAETVSWGRAEHVAAEEMGRSRGYWWSPDGDALLVTRVDEAPVVTWWIADPAHPSSAPQAVRYPAAGTPNAEVTLHHVRLDGRRTEIVWDRQALPYLAVVRWAKGKRPLLQVQSRDQRTAQVLVADVSTGATTVRHTDTDDTWVELFPGTPDWSGDDVVRIADGAASRRLVVGDEPVTGPDVYVRGVVDASDDRVLVTASTGDPTTVGVYAWSRDGGLVEVVAAAGLATAVAGGEVLAVGQASLDHMGMRWTVRAGDGGATHTLTSYAETPVITPQVRFVTLGERQLRAGLLLPRDHVAGTRLPVLVDPYAGPHVQRVLQVRRVWLESQWWADQGFAVLVVDGRGTPGRDPQWERAIHHDLAGPVLEDQIDALRAAAAIEPDLDLGRVAIRGWSFGGYLSALAVLRRPDVFHAAVAGAPVTDWSLYDTHYTERYLGTPQEQPEVYAANSLLDDAPNLDRPLLIVHGLADDNVVSAHTLQLSQRLTESGRPHTVLPLTGVTHMTPQETVAENLLLLQVDFLRRALA